MTNLAAVRAEYKTTGCVWTNTEGKMCHGTVVGSILFEGAEWAVCQTHQQIGLQRGAVNADTVAALADIDPHGWLRLALDELTAIISATHHAGIDAPTTIRNRGFADSYKLGVLESRMVHIESLAVRCSDWLGRYAAELSE